MSIRDFVSLSTRTVQRTRAERALLAACFIGAAVNASQAASVAPAFPATALVSASFNSSVSASSPDSGPATTFVARFQAAPVSLITAVTDSAAYRAPLPELVTASLPRRQQIVAAGDTITGIASTYDPTDDSDQDAGNMETASGERYDPDGWTAAIRTDLREQFGGVRFGRNYLPTLALVESDGKRLIVRINDVGPLREGRIIDLNRRAMRYFDPTLNVGLLNDVRVTPLAGETWALGPLDQEPPSIAVASRFVF